MDLSLHLRKHVIRAAIAASLAGVLAATISGTGTATAPPATGWTHDLLMQREAYHAVLGQSTTVSASPTATPVAATISVALAKTSTVGMPSVVAPGYRTFAFRQLGTHPRDADVAQLKPGYTLTQAQSDLKAANGDDAKALKAFLRLIKGFKFYGGPAPVGQGAVTTGKVTYNLTPGSYYLLNLDDNGTDRTLITPFVVRGKSVGIKPRVAGQLLAKEYTYVIPGALRQAGKHVFEIGNAGAQAHIMVLAAVPAGTTVDGVQQILASDGPPPEGFAVYGDLMGVTTSGGRQYKSINLRPGTYALICFLPEQLQANKGTPHFAEGMVRVFTVN